jgi:hypothetical protein
MLHTVSPQAVTDPVDTPNPAGNMKINLSIYRIGGVLTLNIRLKSRRRSLSKLLIPLPTIWHARLDRA